MDLLLVGPLRQGQSLEDPADGGHAQQVTRHGGMQPKEAPDGLTLYYIDRSPSGIGGVNGTSRLLQVSVNGGDERAVIEPVRFGLWSVIDEGIAFVTIEPAGDALDLYSFATREIRRIEYPRSACHASQASEGWLSRLTVGRRSSASLATGRAMSWLRTASVSRCVAKVQKPSHEDFI